MNHNQPMEHSIVVVLIAIGEELVQNKCKDVQNDPWLARGASHGYGVNYRPETRKSSMIHD